MGNTEDGDIFKKNSPDWGHGVYEVPLYRTETKEKLQFPDEKTAVQ